MTYKSPYEGLYKGSLIGSFWSDKEVYRKTSYTGTMKQLLSEVEADLRSPESSDFLLVRKALNPPRIVHSIVDGKVENPELEEFVLPAINLALNLYRSDSSALRDVLRLREALLYHSNFLNKPFIQMADYITWDSSNPQLSQRSADHILEGIDYDPDLLFIALGHGGIGAGMDVFLRYCDLSESKNSDFYVTRFSTQKLGDQIPRISAKEKDFLYQKSRERRVILFDEDSSSGETMRKAKMYFTSLFGKEPEDIVNSRQCSGTNSFDKYLEFLKGGNEV